MAAKTEKDLPEQHKATWLKAMSAMQLKNYGYTVQLMQSLLKQQPDFLPGRQLARKAAIAKSSSKRSMLSSASFSVMKAQGLLKKDPLAAIEAAEKVLEEEPYNAQANALLRDAALAAKLPETAAFAMETVAEGNPKDVKTLHELARLYRTLEGEHPQYSEKAVAVYNRIVELAPSDLEAIKGAKDASARSSMQKGGWEREGATYRDLIRDKDVAISLEQKGRVVKSKEMIEQQLAELGEKYAQKPDHIDTVRKIAELYEAYFDELKDDRAAQTEALQNATSYYNYAVELTKHSDQSLVRKASDLSIKQFDLFIADCEKFIAEHPGTEEAAACQQQLNDSLRQKSELQLDEAKKRVDSNPTDLNFRFELGEILVNMGNYQAAIPELQKAKSSPSVRLRAMNLLGKAFEARGMLDLSSKMLEEAAAEIPGMDSTKKDIIYNLGLVYEKMGERDKMLKSMKQIYEIDYGYKDVAQRVESSYGA